MEFLGPGSFRIIVFSNSHMQTSAVIMANESGTSTIQIPSNAIVKLEPSDDNIVALSG